ncbi:hypothetical protein H6P81_008373 [Aristolochia fimbriata]|uniref:Uncharacterized protein n=1 Tax=Aristolochia fimbriata TaxID=158543 RepID=A0AAV7F482_ARIFI|nr:hypothetical protein H6P81_008373 [Aristolochia fimbriata]
MAWRAIDGIALSSQGLIHAVLEGDAPWVGQILRDTMVDVNYVGVANLRLRRAEIVLREEEANEVKFEHPEFRMDVTALFAAAHNGSSEIARKLLLAGADVNQKLFRGFAITAAACEGNKSVLDMLVKAGASQPACEEALFEASLCGQAQAVEILTQSEMIRPNALVHAVMSASCRGFVDVITTLIKSGVDVNCKDRILLDSLKPMLHANVDCTPLVASIVSRQVAVVKTLLENGAKLGSQFQLGAWSWDKISGEELRVGPCMGEPYSEGWCAVEYYESSGEILKQLIQHQPSVVEIQHCGRTLLCHAILCHNSEALRILLDNGANANFPIRTNDGRHEYFPIHLAARLGCLPSLQQLILHGCEIDARNVSGETALMVGAIAGKCDCFVELVAAGADLGLTNNSGENAFQLAKRSSFGSYLDDILSRAIISRKDIFSSNLDVFSPLHFASSVETAEPLQILLQKKEVYSSYLNKKDASGFTSVMLAAKAGNTKTFKLLVMAGADISVNGGDGETVGSIIQFQASENDRDELQQILLDAVLANILTDESQFRALHFAAKKGDLHAIVRLLKMGRQANFVDEDDYSPLMVAAREGHADACRLLLLRGGANCGQSNSRGETALSLAKSSNLKFKAAEGVILDYLARSHVLSGERVRKHTRGGRGMAHMKMLQMLKSGVLTWGKSKRKNVVCREAVVGSSAAFCRNQRRGKKGEGVIFRVVTLSGREVHFEVRSASSLELWVRGINLLVKEAAETGAYY